MTHYYEFDQFINNLFDNTQISDDEIPLIIDICYDTITSNYNDTVIIKQLLSYMYFKIFNNNYSIDNIINLNSVSISKNIIDTDIDNNNCIKCNTKKDDILSTICSNCSFLFKYTNLYKLVDTSIVDPIKKNYILSLLNDVPQRSIDEFREITDNLKKIPQPEQRSQAWFDMRYRMLTASDAGTITGVNPYKTLSELIHEKCGQGKPFKGNCITEWGGKYEPCATSIYEVRKNCTVVEHGLIPHPILNNIGASPDGITDDGVMLEIKCPPSRKITGIPPIYYVAQMQMQLEVCNLDVCDFMECKFIEYFTEDDFLSDIGEKPGFTEDNYEKGIVVSAVNINDNKLHYFYSLICIKDQYKIEWAKSEIDRLDNDSNFKDSHITYWRLSQLSIVQVHRDKEWFANNYIKMNNFWNDVVYARENGIQDKYKKRTVSPRKKKPVSLEIELDSDSD